MTSLEIILIIIFILLILFGIYTFYRRYRDGELIKHTPRDVMNINNVRRSTAMFIKNGNKNNNE